MTPRALPMVASAGVAGARGPRCPPGPRLRTRPSLGCGEIVLWCGIALIALPALSGWSLATLISPAFVYVLLTRISGIPLLESRSDARWGEDPAYQAYKARTPVLWPRPPTAVP